jgi:hypothetical protein
MSKPPTPFEPEVVALLQEIVGDPESTLLRVPQARLSKWLTARESPVSPQAPLLTRAERHLLQVHRESAAMLLLQRCVMDLTKGPICETRVYRQVTSKASLPLPSEKERTVAARFELEGKPKADVWGDERGVLNGRTLGNPTVSPSELAAASLRLSPNDQARVWLGVALQRERQDRSAEKALVSVLSNSPLRADEAWARADLGFVRFWQQDFLAAANWYESAARVRTDVAFPSFGMSWMTSALQLGDIAGARDAAQLLSDLVDGTDPVLEEFLSSLRSIPPTVKCRRILAKVRDHVSPVARAIADALLPQHLS